MNQMDQYQRLREFRKSQDRRELLVSAAVIVAAIGLTAILTYSIVKFLNP
jgi:hypothetical protein